MPRKKNQDIFTRIECLYGPIPECLKVILRCCGFNNALAIELIDENAIKDMESFMQTHGKEAINGLKCCNSDQYREQNVFEFTPGHKCTILAITEKTREFNQAALQPNSNEREFAIVSELSEEEHQLSSASSNATECTQVTFENLISSGMINAVSCGIEQVKEKCPVPTVNPLVEEELKSVLITRLKAAVKNKFKDSEYVCEMDLSNVVSMNIQTLNHKSNGTGKCVCPICGSSVQATCQNGRWRISNVVRHITNHIDVSSKKSNYIDGNRNKEISTSASACSLEANTKNGAEDDDAGNNAKADLNLENETDQTEAMKRNRDEILKLFDPLIV